MRERCYPAHNVCHPEQLTCHPEPVEGRIVVLMYKMCFKTFMRWVLHSALRQAQDDRLSVQDDSKDLHEVCLMFKISTYNCNFSTLLL